MATLSLSLVSLWNGSGDDNRSPTETKVEAETMTKTTWNVYTTLFTVFSFHFDDHFVPKTSWKSRLLFTVEDPCLTCYLII